MPQEIKVMASVAIQEAYRELVPRFEQAGHIVTTEWVPTVDLMARLKSGETPDLVIMSVNGIDELIALGKFASDSRVDMVKSGIGIAIRAGEPRPDVSTAAGLEEALRAAKAVAYSTGPSGVYLVGLFDRMGLTEILKPKLKIIKGEPVGAVVARGDAEIGFQQVPELLPVKGIDFIGPLPADIQQITVFSAGRPSGAKNVAGANELVAFLKTPSSIEVFKRTGLQAA